MTPQTTTDPGHPRVTIGMAVFNGGTDLEIALASIAEQDYEDVEIVICDDGSTDGSTERCLSFAKDNPKVRLIRNPERLGMVGNYNQIIGLARGRYLVFADQDDRREPSFISRCLETLEAHPNAVLCHSHTGVVWPGTGGRLYHVNTIDSIDGVENVVQRYWRFLRRHTDTTIYGLIRVDAIRRTAGWQNGLGSASRLLFELLLLGPFSQVPEILYWYTAKGLKHRPGAAEEYERQFGGRAMPRFYIPFLAVAIAETKGIVDSRRSLFEKAALVCVLWSHVLLVNGTKAVFRTLWWLFRGRLPKRFEKACAELVYSTGDLRFVVDPADDPDYYPEGWPLRAV